MARPSTLPEPWRSLALKLGSVQALADTLGVHRSAINRYALGQMKMKKSVQILFDQLLKS